MHKTLIMLTLLGLLTIGATEAAAGTQSRKRPRDGSGDGCVQSVRPAPVLMVVAQGGSGKGGGDQQRKRDGSCSGSGSGKGGGDRQQKRDGSCKA